MSDSNIDETIFLCYSCHKKGCDPTMKKSFWAICIATIALICIFGVTASAYTMAGDDHISDKNGFYYSKTGISPEYGWLYAPDGKLIEEGFLTAYDYSPDRGMANVAFESGKSYYTSPSNFMYRTYTVAERQAIGRP